MTTQYPGGLDDFANPTPSSTLNSPSHSQQHTNLNDAVEAIERELGTSPKGGDASVKARLDRIDGGGSGGPIDHGSLSGLSDNDHPQYALAVNAVMDGDSVSGDISGTMPSPTVVKLYGRALTSTAPSSGQAYVWNGSAWAPLDVATQLELNTHTGSTTAHSASNITFTPAGTIAATDVQAAIIEVASESIQSGATAGGDLSGTLPNPTVVKIRGRAIASATPSSGDAYTWNGTQWVPTAVATSVQLGNHTGASAPHTGHEALSNKDTANGYIGAGSDGKMSISKISATGTANSSTYLRGDGSWAAGGGGGATRITDLLDVSAATPSDGDTLVYDSVLSKWHAIAAGADAVLSIGNSNNSPARVRTTDYKATGTSGSRVDGDAFQTALDAIGSNGGELVVIPGTYYMRPKTTTVNISSGTVTGSVVTLVLASAVVARGDYLSVSSNNATFNGDFIVQSVSGSTITYNSTAASGTVASGTVVQVLPPVRLKNDGLSRSLRFEVGAVINYDPLTYDIPCIRIEGSSNFIHNAQIIGPGVKNSKGIGIDVGGAYNTTSQPRSCVITNPNVSNLRVGLRFAKDYAGASTYSADNVLIGGKFKDLRDGILSDAGPNFLDGPTFSYCWRGIRQSGANTEGSVIVFGASFYYWSDCAIALEGGRISSIDGAICERTGIDPNSPAGTPTEIIRLGANTSIVDAPWTNGSTTTTVVNPFMKSIYISPLDSGLGTQELYGIRLWNCRGLRADRVTLSSLLPGTAYIRVENNATNVSNRIDRLVMVQTIASGWAYSKLLSNALSASVAQYPVIIGTIPAWPGDAAGTTIGHDSFPDSASTYTVFTDSLGNYWAKAANGHIVSANRDTGKYPTATHFVNTAATGAQSVSGLKTVLAAVTGKNVSVRLGAGIFDLGYNFNANFANADGMKFRGSGQDVTFFMSYFTGTNTNPMVNVPNTSSRVVISDMSISHGGDFALQSVTSPGNPSGNTTIAVALDSVTDCTVERVRFLAARDRAVFINGKDSGIWDIAKSNLATPMNPGASLAHSNTVRACSFDGQLLSTVGSTPAIGTITPTVGAVPATTTYVTTWVDQYYRESAAGTASTATLASASTVSMTIPAVTPPSGSTVIARKLYRAISGQYWLVATIWNNTNNIAVDDSNPNATLTVSPGATNSGNTPLPLATIQVGVDLIGAWDNSIADNHMRYCYRGVRLFNGTNGSAYVTSAFNTITNNFIEYNRDHGIVLAGSRYNEVAFNRIRNNNQRANSVGAGINIVDTANITSEGDNIHHNQIWDDQNVKTQTRGVRIISTTSGIFGTTVKFNDLRGNLTYGIDNTGTGTVIDGNLTAVNYASTSAGINDAGTRTKYGNGAIDVTDFGAYNDNTNPALNKLAIQAALDAGAGKLVYFPPGVYKTAGPLQISTATVVVGAGCGEFETPAKATTVALNSGDNHNLFELKTITTAAVRIADMSLVGNRSGQTATSNAIYFANNTASALEIGDPDSRHAFENLRIYSFRDWGINLLGGTKSRENRITNVSVFNCGNSGTNVGGGVYLNNASDSTLDDVFVSAAGGTISTTLDTNSYGIRIAGGSNRLVNVKACYSNGYGFSIEGARTSLVGCQSQDNNGSGFVITTSDNLMLACMADTNGTNAGANTDRYGLWMKSGDYNTISSFSAIGRAGARASFGHTYSIRVDSGAGYNYVAARQGTDSPGTLVAFSYGTPDTSNHIVDLLNNRSSLSGLSDVTLTSPTSGDTLSYNGTSWVNVSSAGGVIAGTGLGFASTTLNILNTGATPNTYGSASKAIIGTVNAQGQFTAISQTDIAITESQVANLDTDLTAKQSISAKGTNGGYPGLANGPAASLDAATPLLIATQIPPVVRLPRASGRYYYVGDVTNSTTSSPAIGTMKAIPDYISQYLNIVRIGLEVVTASTGASTIRLGIYADKGDGSPGARIIDAGTIDGTSATVQEITINISLVPGWYWFSAVIQGAPSVLPVYRGITYGSYPGIGMTAIPTANLSPVSYSSTGITGAYPDPAPTFASGGTSGPKIFYKVG